MADNIKTQVEQLLREGMGKKKIWEKLRTADNQQNLAFHLNNQALHRDRVQYRYLNLFLACVLTFVTVKKIYAATMFGRFDLYWLLSLVVPMVNVFMLKEILRCHRIGYQFLFVLSCLSLVQPANRVLEELVYIIVMILLAGFFYWKFFPRKNMIQPGP